MNDRQNPYDPYAHEPYAQQPELIGYDAYGQPVYQQPAQQQPEQTPQYDPYAQQQPPQQQAYGYDPYTSQAQQPAPYDPYAPAPQQTAPHPGETYGYGTGTQQEWIPQQAPAPQHAPQRPQAAEPQQIPAQQRGHRADGPDDVPRTPRAEAAPGRPRPDGGAYATEQFSFVEEPDENSEDVIDWLKFSESRTERREEAKRRGRSRIVALGVVLALVVAGGLGYLWYADMLPGMSSGKNEAPVANGAQKRDVIALHLHHTDKPGTTSTVLLVNNATTRQGTTVLLPNALALADDNGVTTTLAKSVEDDGGAGTRESLGSALGTSIGGTWRLDTPYLENLVEMVGGIEIDTDTAVPDTQKGTSPLVNRGARQTLSGRMAVAYSTYRAPGEPEAKQLARFGAVMQGVLKKISDDPKVAEITVKHLVLILDPSLTEQSLAASLARLAEHAKKGAYRTVPLPVRADGRVSESDTVVKSVLGGTASAPEQGSAVRVGVRNASGKQPATEAARIALVNGGYAFTDAGRATVTASSKVTYADAAQKAKAEEVAKTLGLPASAVTKGAPAQNAEVSVTLGQDYKVPAPQ
ncbi:LytR C-terminal domain-containing protein [Streptomyces sp. NPDC058657]|uniref:LCP family protein n=1 Tax=unclassified Streptomyces TaxID=2593676 RepID=UPI00366503DA